jgi:hypothetical protein
MPIPPVTQREQLLEIMERYCRPLLNIALMLPVFLLCHLERCLKRKMAAIRDQSVVPRKKLSRLVGA